MITEGVKYIGSKSKLLPYLSSVFNDLGGLTYFDGFSGTTRVSQHLSNIGKQVIANDRAIWSQVFSNCYLKGNGDYHELIAHLNNVKPISGWFTKHYGGVADGELSMSADGLKKPFQLHNTMKLDAIRKEIDILELDDITKSVALTSLILGMDKVDSTVGHHTSYLKKWSKRSYNDLILDVPKIPLRFYEHKVYHDDIFNVVGDIQCDVAYYDPPYGSGNKKMPSSRVRYQSYYHIWETICRNDEPDIFGKSYRREDSRDAVSYSPFEDYRLDDVGNSIHLSSIIDLVSRTKSQYIVLSYNSSAGATLDELCDSMSSYTITDIHLVDYTQNVMSRMKSTNEWLTKDYSNHKEYIIVIKK